MGTKIIVDNSPGKGRGIFAKKKIKAGEVIEVAPVILIPESEGDGTVLRRYVFEWEDNQNAIALGLVSLYNHSYQPNADFDFDDLFITITAFRDIKAGEELTINYNGDEKPNEPMEFDVL